MSIGIYKITSPTGKVYIGQSVNIERRHRDYKYMGCFRQLKIYHSLKKYGYAAHKFEALVTVAYSPNIKETLNKLEAGYIAMFKSDSLDGLNIQRGGDAGSISDATREKMRLSHLGKTISISHRQAFSESNRRRVRPIVQLTKSGEFVAEYCSITEASLLTGITTATLTSVCKKRYGAKTAKGFNFEYKENCKS